MGNNAESLFLIFRFDPGASLRLRPLYDWWSDPNALIGMNKQYFRRIVISKFVRNSYIQPIFFEILSVS
jgi:hypothetical protein